MGFILGLIVGICIGVIYTSFVAINKRTEREESLMLDNMELMLELHELKYGNNKHITM